MLPTEMNPLSTLLLILAAGGTVSTDSDRLVVTGAKMCDELREAIRHNKAELLAIAKGDGSTLWPQSPTPLI